MRVLVVYGSKHGATREIAEAVGLILKDNDFDVTVHKAEDVDENVVTFDAVVVGSSVYAGRWRKPVYDFVLNNAEMLSERPTWLFSSGPIGEPLRPVDEVSVDIEPLLAVTKVKEHRIFPGKLDKSQLSFGERAIVFAVGGAEGDYRDWDEINSWAEGIAEQLKKKVS